MSIYYCIKVLIMKYTKKRYWLPYFVWDALNLREDFEIADYEIHTAKILPGKRIRK